MQGYRNGFVLFVFLVYMQALLLFILLAFSLVSEDYLRASLALKMAEMTIRAKNLLNGLEQDNPSCGLVAMSTTQKLKQASRSWWAIHSCVGYDQKNKYFFIRELIGKKNLNNEKHAGKHVVRYEIYRNTLLYESGVNVFNGVLLQSTAMYNSGVFSRRLVSRFLW